ncbi:SIMPL domain-containing protein [Selenomonas felix]|uniref:SIMPL domain-containing protein n=1 Tax=Selenomonas felix TaxID=1944634 RepID=UPI000C8268E7|nr:SIMPL domain-containing protein [Selenomonas felix]
MKQISFTSLARTSVLALALALPMGAASAAETTAPTPATITIGGTGTAYVAPDTAEITVGVVTEEADAARTHAENAAQTARVHNAVRALGVADRDIQTVHYDFSQRYDMRDGSRSEVIGYTAQNSVVITVRDLNNVGKIIDAALANGANRIDSLNFTASDTSAAKNEALTDAVHGAKEKAQAVASALGARLVRIANVYADTQADMPRNENYMPMMMAKGASAAATPIAPGELSVAATVNVTYVVE